MPEHNDIMDYLRFFGPYLSTVIVVALVYGFHLWKKRKSFDKAATETDGEMTGKDGFNLLMDLRMSSQNLVRDHERFQKNLDELEKRMREDHDKLIRLETKIDASK